MSQNTGRTGSSLPNRLLNVLVGITAICAVVVTALVVRRELTGPGAGPAATDVETSGTVAEWRDLLEAGHALGPPDAPVQIVAFSDFQCPACRALATSIRALRAQFPEAIRFVYRHYPLPNHSHATTAAHASECAARQGAFLAFHDALFAEQEVIGYVPWRYFATVADLRDLDQFSACMRAEPSERVTRDREAGEELGVDGTPTLVLNGRRIGGAPPYPALEELVRAELGNWAGQAMDRSGTRPTTQTATP